MLRERPAERDRGCESNCESQLLIAIGLYVSAPFYDRMRIKRGASLPLFAG
jgi:hypothetical protein